MIRWQEQEWEESVFIHHSSQGWLVTPVEVERWTVILHRGEVFLFGEVSQKAAEVEAGAESLLFRPGCIHRWRPAHLPGNPDSARLLSQAPFTAGPEPETSC